MKERILQFLRSENKTSSQLAEEISVQPSSISHIISGRNKPSLDFILKMLETYIDLETDWLLFGRGEMYKNQIVDTLFDDNSFSDDQKADNRAAGESKPALQKENSSPGVESEVKAVEKVIILHSDNSFSEYSKS
ncbi:MAG: helix-turn-helix domain-containing protein [Bacteroidales bacterium]|nr:helix-turn-helix domain-containing protein [Bacteroidales bacterium]